MADIDEAGRRPPIDALDMARNAAAAVLAYADYQDQDPVGAYIARAGQQGHDSAFLAGHLALVAIAVDLRRIADMLEAGR